MLGSLRNIRPADIFILIVLFLPNNAIGSLIQILLTGFIVIYYRTLFTERIAGISLHKLLFFSALIISLFYSLLSGYEFYTSVIIKLVYLTVLILSFPIIKQGAINNKTIFIAISIILFTQLSYVFGLGAIVRFIDTYYTSEGYFNSYEVVANETEIVDILSLRFGGIYRNSNQAGRIITLLLGILLVNFSRKKFTTIFYVNAALLIISVLLTGSRTSFFVMMLFFISYYILFGVKKHYHIFLIGLLGIFTIAILAKSGSRLLDLSDFASGEAKKGSFTSKRVFLENYLDQAYIHNPADLIFGRFNLDQVYYDYGLPITKFDAEFGYIIHGIGLFGLFALLIFLLRLFIVGGPRTRLLFILLIWMITSTVFTNLRFSLLFMFIASLYFTDRRLKTNVSILPEGNQLKNATPNN